MCGTSEARTTYTSGVYGFTPGCYVYCSIFSIVDHCLCFYTFSLGNCFVCPSIYDK